MGLCFLHMQVHAIAMRSLQAIKGLYVIGIHLSKRLLPPGVSVWDLLLQQRFHLLVILACI